MAAHCLDTVVMHIRSYHYVELRITNIAIAAALKMIT